MNTQTIFQRTLKQSVSFIGLGLHSGKKSRITLKPCENATGIFFTRKDVPYHQSLIPARWDNVTDTNLSTVLSNHHGHSVSTVEHLMAALQLCHIDNLEIEVDGNELPIMDGSAKPFVDVLLRVGTRAIKIPKKAIFIHKKIEVREENRFALLLPDSQPKVSISIDFKEKAIGIQSLCVNTNDHNLKRSIAPARTFGFLDQIRDLQRKGLALGGSLSNAILVDNDRIVNHEGLRFKDEFVRHKVLDAIGDLALVGVPIIGHYHAFKGGHLLNTLLMNKLFTDKSAWSYVSMDKSSDYKAEFHTVSVH
ncbi:MAG: UDP-3-O-acyl-N-acetylglucosamine deacetylase [Gammaproteobacteria bacterium]|jgi:UDP-3-O-[3-hydroxymyristoyl] N-acetylglucosamine deacetylase|nr:UDP-3-O-acyl-N-acetylglucosamine deacetylase [Gammaproteobacteria bacterium]